MTPVGWAVAVAVVLVLSVILGWLIWLLIPLAHELGWWVRGLFYRPAHGGLDVLSSPTPSPLGSMQLDDDRAAWEARPPVAAWLEDDRAWRRQFAATHSAVQVQAAFDQQGGWDSGACDDPGGPFMGMDLPPDEAGPGPLLSAPGAGRSDVTGPGHGAQREAGTASFMVHETLWPGHPAEVAHDEYMAGPAAVLVHPPAPAAGPVPLTTDDLALAAWTCAELSRQDADTLNYLHDYKMRLAS
jgi:hypothetical protein